MSINKSINDEWVNIQPSSFTVNRMKGLNNFKMLSQKKYMRQKDD